MKRREQSVGRDRSSSKNDKKAPKSPSKKTKSKRESSQNISTDTFEARRSTRVDINKFSHHDGDSWQETLAVCEMPATKQGVVKMKIRSYYSNKRTGDRVWDEPPSGASRILPATEEMRKMAQAQLQEMQITFGTALNEPPANKRKSFFRNKTSKTSPSSSSENGATSPKYKVKYKPGSILSKIKKEPPKPRQHDDSLDPQIQKAIALSMNESTQQQDNEEPLIRSEVAFQDDEMAMIMAMSLSEQESKRQPQMSEEQELQRAIQESRRSTSTRHAAAMPIKDEFSGLESISKSSSSDEPRRRNRNRAPSSKKVATKRGNSDDSSLDKKMPAKSISVQKHRDRAKEGSKRRSPNTLSSDSNHSSHRSSSSVDKKMPAKSISVRNHRERPKEGSASDGDSSKRRPSFNSESSADGDSRRSLSSRDKKMPAKAITVKEYRDRAKDGIILDRDSSRGRSSSNGTSSANSSQSHRSLSLDNKVPAKSISVREHRDRSSKEPSMLARVKSNQKGAARERTHSSQSLSSGGSDRYFVPDENPKPRSSRSISSAGSGRSSLTDGTRDSRLRSSTNGAEPASRSSRTVSSNGSTRSLMTEGRSDRSARRMAEDSSDKKPPPSKPAPSASGKYGKSVRPVSSKNLTIARSSSGGSRHSLSSSREQAPPKSAPSTSDFSPYGDKVRLSSSSKGTEVSLDDYSESRSAQRSVFGSKIRQEFINENVSLAKNALKEHGLDTKGSGTSSDSSRRRSS